jgi:hypothetical protein
MQVVLRAEWVMLLARVVVGVALYLVLVSLFDRAARQMILAGWGKLQAALP